MARSEHLPIYKSSYDLCLYFEQVVRNFSRYHKYSLGSDLRDGARRVLKLVVRANARRDKTKVLLAVREELEELKVLLRLANDSKAFANFHSFEHAIRLVTEIAKQNEGWLKYQRQGPGQSRSAMPEGLTGPGVP
jgi:four helix bundle protein